MTNNVSPEEVDALLESEGASAAGRVALRDFKTPRRLSVAQQRSIRAGMSKLLPALEGKVRTWLQSDFAVELEDVGETSAHGLFEELEDPIVVRNVEVGGVQGWVVWENAAAVAAATVAMSCEPDEVAEARALTPLESGLVGDFIEDLSQIVAVGLGLDMSMGAMSQSVRTFLSRLDTEGGDPQRLYLHLTLDGPGGPSILRLYLPGVLPEVCAPGDPPPALPTHLDSVPVELRATLGTVELELDDLMKLEVGDVIPLTGRVGDSIEVCVEDSVAGRASWGNLRGRMAMRIEQLNTDL